MKLDFRCGVMSTREHFHLVFSSRSQKTQMFLFAVDFPRLRKFDCFPREAGQVQSFAWTAEQLFRTSEIFPNMWGWTICGVRCSTRNSGSTSGWCIQITGRGAFTCHLLDYVVLRRMLRGIPEPLLPICSRPLNMSGTRLSKSPSIFGHFLSRQYSCSWSISRSS